MDEKKKITWSDLIQISDVCFEIPESFRADMRVPARVFMSKDMFEDISEDRSLLQLVNVATLPGIQKAAYAMPDIHQGYGFPIGGVAATAIDEDGVISPGGIGYDINCGVRLLVANMPYAEVQPYLEKLATALFEAVPSGVGCGGKLRLDRDEMDRVLLHGAHRMVQQGYGNADDIAHCEEEGRMAGASIDQISDHAKKRGADQLGTLGSGNHFLEIQRVDTVYDEEIARAYGLAKDAVCVMIHCGSRGLGHQTCTDHVKQMMGSLHTYGYELPDRELVCAPFTSPEGQNYFAAMAAASNFAWANRHLIGHWVREAWQKIMGESAQLSTVYDVSHNIGKREVHVIDGKKKQVLMHRKGATRAFGPGTSETPADYRVVGQPVFIPGTMGTASYVLAGTTKGMEIAFGSSCHGAGRRMSRAQAKKTVRGTELRKELESHGIIVRCDSDAGLAEEAPIAYKDVDSVVNVVDTAGMAKKVVRVAPIAVIKGG